MWLSEAQVRDSWVVAYESSLKYAGDATFARLLFEPDFDHGLIHLEARSRNAIAERLLDLGFPERGQMIFVETGVDADVLLAARIAREQGIAEDGYRLMINCRDHGGQEVFHLHLHLLGGRPLGPMLSRRS